MNYFVLIKNISEEEEERLSVTDMKEQEVVFEELKEYCLEFNSSGYVKSLESFSFYGEFFKRIFYGNDTIFIFRKNDNRKIATIKLIEEK